MNRPLKYAKIISELQLDDCPPLKCGPCSRTGYRFVNAALDDDSFLPQGVREPQRLTHPDPKGCCSNLALSMFNTEAAARKKFNWLHRKFRNYAKLTAEKLAMGTLTEDDGLQSKPGSSGHFDLHEYSDTDLRTRFKIVGDLP